MRPWMRVCSSEDFLKRDSSPGRSAAGACVDTLVRKSVLVVKDYLYSFLTTHESHILSYRESMGPWEVLSSTGRFFIRKPTGLD